MERRWTQNTQNIPLKRKQSSACPNNINKLFVVYVYASMYTSVCLLCQTSASVYLFLPFSYRVSFQCMKSFTCSSCQSIEKAVTGFPEQCRYDQAINPGDFELYCTIRKYDVIYTLSKWSIRVAIAIFVYWNWMWQADMDHTVRQHISRHLTRQSQVRGPLVL